MVRAANIERMKLMYHTELSGFTEADRDSLLLALATLTSFESWDQLRHCYNLKPCDIRRSTGCCRETMSF